MVCGGHLLAKNSQLVRSATNRTEKRVTELRFDENPLHFSYYLYQEVLPITFGD